MNLQRALATPGWMFPDELAYLAQAASKCELVAEVGSWLGRSTCAIACNLSDSPSSAVFAIDTWKGSEEQGGEVPPQDLLKQFLLNVNDLPVVDIQKTSLEAANWLTRYGYHFDMIFIDAKHDYESVSADIKAWIPLLRKDGILCGHDYHPNWPGVIQAVNELVPKFRTVNTIWTTEV